MIHVLATITLAPGKRAEWLAAFKELMPLVHAEEGCIEYAPAVDIDSGLPRQEPPCPDEAVIVEKWASLDYLRRHLQAPHMAAYRERVKGLVLGAKLRILRADMSDEPGLLRSIADAPEDDTPRLVYADWLDDHGHGERAEFLRLQVQLETTDEADERYPELLARSRRCGVLTGEASTPWRTHVPGARVQFRRGLIDSVRMKAVEYLKTPGEAWAEVPTRTLWLDTGDDAGAAVAARPELSRLTGLLLRGWRADDLGALLCDNPRLAGLHSLRLDLQPTGLSNFLGGRERKFGLPALESLRVAGTPPDWAAALRMCKRPLRRVFFWGYSEFPDEDGYRDAHIWDRLVASKHWRSLREAIVWYALNTTSDGHSDETDRFSDLPGALLKGRHLESFSFHPRQYLSLAPCATWFRVKSLMVMQAPDADTSGLMHCPQAGRLESLTLGYWDFSLHRRQMPDWGERSPLANLRRLSIMCMAGGQLPALLSGPYCPNLLRLDIARYLGAESISQLAAASLPRLRHLSLGGYGGLPSFRPLLKSKAMPNLCTLKLVGGWGGVRQDEAAQLAALLARSKTMPHLSLIGAGERYWALRDGEALPVPPHLAPLPCDWWRHGPDDEAA